MTEAKTTIDKILHYIDACSGLDHEMLEPDQVRVMQKIDGKQIKIDSRGIEEVLSRVDADGKSFIQINFVTGSKILLTEQLVGFKPLPSKELDMEKLPNVVTTPDLFSVFEAIQEAMSEDCGAEDIEVLRKVFESVVQGGEAIGFDLSEEKGWLQRLTFTITSTVA